MNVFKKIKRFSRRAPIMFLSCALFAAIPLSSSAQITSNVTGGENLTPGYTALLVDYPKVQKQMQDAVAQGNAAQWRAWMDSGVRKNESMYWWLLADWLWSTGKKDDAYKALIQAFVFMKVELPGCGFSAVQATDTANSMLRHHSYILTTRPSQDTIKSAVLEAITRAENHLNRGTLLPEMSCHFMEAQKAKNGRAQTIKIGSTPTEQRAFQRKMMQQRTSLRSLKSEMSYSTMWNYSDANLLWKIQDMK